MSFDHGGLDLQLGETGAAYTKLDIDASVAASMAREAERISCACTSVHLVVLVLLT